MLDTTTQHVPTSTVATLTTIAKGGALDATVIRPTGREITRPLIALHGIGREIEAFVNVFSAQAEMARRTVIIPHFDERTWRVFQRITKKHRPDLALLALIEDLRLRGVIGAGGVDMFGYSGGAQLAHRFTMLHPEHVRDLHLGAAGWYTLPDGSLPYPIGLGASDTGDTRWGRRMKSALARYLDRRFSIYVGDKDAELISCNLRRTPELDAAQGKTRIERAHQYHSTISSLQERQGLPVRAQLHTLTGCAHDFTDCAVNGGLADLITRPVCTD
jgi:pimeloyl-ACP methyl ester carboxylesterase